MNISISGSTGFVGKNLILLLRNSHSFIQFLTRKDFEISNYSINSNSDVLIHLSGKAHDLKKTTSLDEYYQINTNITREIFDAFLESNAKVFITLSSVKAVSDRVKGKLTEDEIPNPQTHYGKSKLLAEKYILSKLIPEGKRFYILRPCMIHGPGNKGNLNLLYKVVSKGMPWPLGAFKNKRSFCSIDNLIFIFKELIEREDIPSGIYNVADDLPISTNEVISIMAESQQKKPKIWKISVTLIKLIAYIGDIFRLPLTSERLQKLTESYIVSNLKIKTAIGKEFPVSAKDGLIKTFNSFHKNVQ
jgi:nucleoside-diphosphate-sugar epimerase